MGSLSRLIPLRREPGFDEGFRTGQHPACMRLRVFASMLSLLVPAFAPADETTLSTVPSNENAKSVPEWYEACARRVAEAKTRRCEVIFIGDSITQRWTDNPLNRVTAAPGQAFWDRYFARRGALNFGVGSDKTQHVLWRLDKMDMEGLKPKVAVILIGTNNHKDPVPQVIAGVKAVVAKTHQVFPGAKIVLVSILPSERAYEKMARANLRLKKWAEEAKLTYVDVASKMPVEGNSWKGLAGDKLHLSREGYGIFAEELEPVLARLLAAR